MVIDLPFPSAKMSGHNTGHWRGKSSEIAALRQVAKTKARSTGWKAPEAGDIYLRFTFIPPDRRSDRCNYYNRCKAIIDGIADGLKVNDSRFVPEMDRHSFKEPEKPGRIIVEART